jgi:hypothetical protein
MKNTTQTIDKNLTSFKREIEYASTTEANIVLELKEKAFSEYSIEWYAKDFIKSNEKARVFNSIKFDIEKLNILNDHELREYLIDKMKSLVYTAKSYRHNSTCAWRNAISFAQNEAILEVIDYIQRYI